MQFYRKSDFKIEPVTKTDGTSTVLVKVGKKIKATITLNDRTFKAMVPAESLERLQAWQAPEEAPALLEQQSPSAAADHPG